ncbi:MAG TPA: hypothetical protein VGV63_00280 [Acidimicrobiales bacterium]|nr:hypothetical protein [Acidimicrobiales bacterium]
MKNLLRRLSKADDPARRQELERQAADEIKAVGNTPPAEANSGSWAPSAPATAQPESASAPAEPDRRLTAQQRLAARNLQTQN